MVRSTRSKRRFGLNDILRSVKCPFTVVGDPGNRFFTHAGVIEEANSDTLAWIKRTKANKQEVVEKSKAVFVICDESIDTRSETNRQKCFIVVDEPKLAFARAVKELFCPRHEYGVHPTAFVDDNAVVHNKTYIGPFAYVGKCTIGEGTVIYGHCHLYDGVVIGKNVTIHAGAVLGADGFGYSRNKNGRLEKFPHIGGIIIEDDVEVGANACIDRGALGNTLIKEGAKIDNLVHIAHNVVVGRHAMVIALAMVGGSTQIGDYAWISPGSSLLNGIKIGEKATVGMGAVVLKDIPDGETWAGCPARPIVELVDARNNNCKTASPRKRVKRMK